MSEGCRYAGADWIRAMNRTKKELSPIGEEVADLLGELFLGIYHIERDVRRADWSTTGWITMTITGQCWSSFDGDLLTRLVLLAHDRCIRVEMEAVAPRVMRLSFHKRQRTSEHVWGRHPTLEHHAAYLRR